MAGVSNNTLGGTDLAENVSPCRQPPDAVFHGTEQVSLARARLVKCEAPSSRVRHHCRGVSVMRTLGFVVTASLGSSIADGNLNARWSLAKRAEATSKQTVRNIRKQAKRHALPFTQVNDWLLKEVLPKLKERRAPVSWTTPTGFRVVQDNRHHDSELIEIHIGEERVRLALRSMRDELNYDAIRSAVSQLDP
jgi:hypothetical protein